MPLTNWQQFISERFPGAGNQPSSDELSQLAQEFFGNIPLPPGITEEMVTTRRGDYVEYRDAEGYVHRIGRELDGRSPNVGQITSTDTNRPAVNDQSRAGEQDVAGRLLRQLEDLFNQQSQQRGQPQDTGVTEWLNRLTQVFGQLQNQPALASLDPATQAALNTIQQNTQAQANQQFQRDQGSLVAQLFGSGVNQSSMAGEQANRLLQGQGLVTSQIGADAAQRELAVRQFLSQLGQGNLALAGQTATAGGQLSLDEFGRLMQGRQFEQGQLQNFVSDLLGQALSREVSSGQLGLESARLQQQANQFNRSEQQAYIQFQEQQRAMERANTWNNIFRGAAIAGSFGLSGAGSSLFSGLGSGNMGGYTASSSPQFGTYGTPPLTGFPR